MMTSSATIHHPQDLFSSSNPQSLMNSTAKQYLQQTTNPQHLQQQQQQHQLSFQQYQNHMNSNYSNQPQQQQQLLQSASDHCANNMFDQQHLLHPPLPQASLPPPPLHLLHHQHGTITQHQQRSSTTAAAHSSSTSHTVTSTIPFYTASTRVSSAYASRPDSPLRINNNNDASCAQVLFVSNCSGRFAALEALASQNGASAIVHCGYFGILDRQSISRMDDRKLVLFGKSMGFDNLFNASDATLFAQSLRKYFLDNTPPSEFEDLAARKYHFSVPIYILPGLFDDEFLLNQIKRNNGTDLLGNIFPLECGLTHVINFGSTRFRLICLPSPPLTEDDMAAGGSLSRQYANLFNSFKSSTFNSSTPAPSSSSGEVRLLLSNHLPNHDLLYPKLAQFLNVDYMVCAGSSLTFQSLSSLLPPSSSPLRESTTSSAVFNLIYSFTSKLSNSLNSQSKFDDCNFVVEQMSRCLNASKLDPAVGSFPSSPPSQSCARILTLPPLEQGLALFNITASQITHMFVCDGINLADRLAAHVGAVLGSLAVDGPYSSTADRNLAIQPALLKSKLDAHCRQSESESSNLVAGSGATKNLPLPPTIPSPWNNPGFSAAELGSSSTSTSGNAATSAIGSWDTISNTSETSITGSQTFECMTIWVGNLPEAVSELDIRSFFRNVNILKVKLTTNRPDKRPCAFIDVADTSALEAALRLGGERLHGSRLKVEYDPSRLKKDASAAKTRSGCGHNAPRAPGVVESVVGRHQSAAHPPSNGMRSLDSGMSLSSVGFSSLPSSASITRSVSISSDLGCLDGSNTFASSSSNNALNHLPVVIEAASPTASVSEPQNSEDISSAAAIAGDTEQQQQVVAPESVSNLSQSLVLSNDSAINNNSDPLSISAPTSNQDKATVVLIQPTWDSPPRKQSTSFSTGASWDKPNKKSSSGSSNSGGVTNSSSFAAGWDSTNASGSTVTSQPSSATSSAANTASSTPWSRSSSAFSLSNNNSNINAGNTVNSNNTTASYSSFSSINNSNPQNHHQHQLMQWKQAKEVASVSFQAVAAVTAASTTVANTTAKSSMSASVPPSTSSQTWPSALGAPVLDNSAVVSSSVAGSGSWNSLADAMPNNMLGLYNVNHAQQYQTTTQRPHQPQSQQQQQHQQQHFSSARAALDWQTSETPSDHNTVFAAQYPIQQRPHHQQFQHQNSHNHNNQQHHHLTSFQHQSNRYNQAQPPQVQQQQHHPHHHQQHQPPLHDLSAQSTTGVVGGFGNVNWKPLPLEEDVFSTRSSSTTGGAGWGTGGGGGTMSGAHSTVSSAWPSPRSTLDRVARPPSSDPTWGRAGGGEGGGWPRSASSNNIAAMANSSSSSTSNNNGFSSQQRHRHMSQSSTTWGADHHSYPSLQQQQTSSWNDSSWM